MKQVTATGQTVKEAVESALAQLNTSEERTEVSIIDEGKRGLFGIFGSRPAVVKVKLVVDPIDEAKKYLVNVCEQMDAPVSVETEQNGRNIKFSLSGEKIALLIGKRGQTLNSLQYLTQLVANRYSDEYLMIILDAENYRKRREETLTRLAERLARKATQKNKEVSLEPMPSFERKIIHSALANNNRIRTYSTGTEPFRRIVIAPEK